MTSWKHKRENILKREAEAALTIIGTRVQYNMEEIKIGL